jgi:hypothetical protein
MCASACRASCSPICSDRALICSVRVGQDGVQGLGDAGLGGAIVAGRAAGCGDQAGVQDGGAGAAAVAGAGQPGSEAFGREPASAVLSAEAGQELQADRRVDLGEQPDRARERVAQVGAQLIGDRDAVADQVFAGPAGTAQADGGRAVRRQRRQPGPVGAQRVRQHAGVEAVIFVPGRPVPAAQVLDLVRADHHHGDPRLEQGARDRAAGSFDRGLPGAAAGQHGEQFAQAGGAVPGGAPADLTAPGIDDGYGVIITCPVDPARHVAGRFFGQGISGRLQVCLLAASPSGEAPSCGAGTRLPACSQFGARWRSALSAVGTSRVTARSRRTHDGRQERQASRAMTQRHLRCISSLTATDTRMVHQ